MWNTINIILLIIGVVVITLGIYIDKRSSTEDYTIILFLFFGLFWFGLAAFSWLIKFVVGFF